MNVNISWGSGGLVGVIILGITLVYTGKLVAKPTMDRIIQSIVDAYEGRIRDKDERIRVLTEANDRLTATNSAFLSQHYQVLEIGRTTNSVVQALSTATSGGGADGADVGQAAS